MVYKYAARFDEAEALYQRALAAIEATLGPDHPDTATVWHNLGGIEHARGRHAAGEPYARRSVQIREAALGAEHPAVAADIAALAALVQEQGRLDEAECLYRRALSVFESTYGTDHYEVAVTCNNLGALEAAREKPHDAEKLYRRGSADQGKHPRWRPPRRRNDAAQPRRPLRRSRSCAGSQGAACCALVIFESTLGPEHPKVRASRDELARLT